MRVEIYLKKALKRLKEIFGKEVEGLERELIPLKEEIEFIRKKKKLSD